LSQAKNNRKDRSQDDDDDGKRQAVIDQYRDWLIPGAIFSSVSASVFLLIVTTKGSTGIFLAALICSFASIGVYILGLFYSFSKIENLAILEEKADADEGPLFFLALLGTSLLLSSFVILSFDKSLIAGGCIAALFAILVFIFIRVMSRASH
jgi:hypothetical protein